MNENFKKKSVLHEAFMIIVLSIILAFVYNYFSSKSVPIIRENVTIEYVNDEELFSNSSSNTIAQKYISTNHMLDLIKSGEALIIDSRNHEAYVKGHIPKSINIPFLDVFNYMEKLQSIPRDTLIVIYCEGIHCELSKNLAEFLKGMNFKKIFLYPEGFEVWLEKKLPVETNK